MKRRGFSTGLVTILLVAVLLSTALIVLFVNSPPRQTAGVQVGTAPAQVSLTVSLATGVSPAISSYGLTVNANPINGNFPSPIVYATMKTTSGQLVAVASYNFGATFLSGPQDISLAWASGPIARGNYVLILSATDSFGNQIAVTTSTPVSITS